MSHLRVPPVVGTMWWRVLGSFGLTQERWRRWPRWQRRLVLVLEFGIIGFLVSILVNGLERIFAAEGAEAGSLVTFSSAAYITFAVVLLLVVPPWDALPPIPVRLLIPAGLVLAGVVGAVLAVVTEDTKVGVISSVGILAAVLGPPYTSRHREGEVDAPPLTSVLHGSMPLGRKVIPLAALALAITFPYYTDSMFTLPIFGKFPSTETAVVMLIFMMMAVGLNIVVGYAGLLDLGYVAFYAVGAYTAAWLASFQFQATFHFGAVGIGSEIPGIHVSIWLLLALAGITTALIGVIIGLPTLRLRGDYLAIVTLGFGEIMPQVARNGNDFFGTGFNLTGGPQGITPVDSPGFGTKLSDITDGFLPANYLTHPESARVFYWSALVLLLFTIFTSLRLRDSRLGRAWIAIREDEVAASAMGIPLMRTKTWSYACGAFFGGIAGAYFAAFKSSTFPQDFFFNISVLILCMVILGGMGNIWGVLVGAAFLEYLDREGLANTGAWVNEHFGTNIDVPLYSGGIYGIIIVVIMLFRPQGLIPSARRKRELELGTHDEPAYDVAH